MRNPWKILLLLLLPGVVAALGCNMEKEVEIELPPYERELVAECFMEVGKPFRLILTESLAYTELNDTPIVAGAQVVISHGAVRDTLRQGLYLEPEGFKIYNYGTSTLVPADYTTEYNLDITHEGRHLVGTARVMQPVQMGSLSLSYNADSMASLTMRWPDIAGQDNYYLVSLHQGTVFSTNPDVDPLLFDFTLDDRIGDGEMFTIATLFDFESGDTLITTLYHIDKGYWQYMNSLDDAASSNGNPFAQPGVIHSTVVGGRGVFTGFIPDRDTIIVP